MGQKQAIPRNPDNTWTSDTLSRGDIGAVMQRVLEEPAYLTSRDFVGATPLLTAIGFCDASLVEFMLHQGADPNAEVNDGYTALLTAIESKKPASVQIVSQLIAAGADIHTKGTNGWTSLHMAAVHGHLEKARLLIDAGARVNERKTIDAEETPLMDAAYQGYPAIVRLLLDHGADPSLRDTIHGRTSLEMAQYAAKGVDPEVLEFIKTVDYGPSKAEILARLDVPVEANEMVKAMFTKVDMTERYREIADQLSRDRDHEGVIQVLATFEYDEDSSPRPQG